MSYSESSATRRDHILGVVEELVADFLYYDRKNDEDLPQGEIEAALLAKEVTIKEIVARFSEALKEGLS